MLGTCFIVLGHSPRRCSHSWQSVGAVFSLPRTSHGPLGPLAPLCIAVRLASHAPTCFLRCILSSLAQRCLCARRTGLLPPHSDRVRRRGAVRAWRRGHWGRRRAQRARGRARAQRTRCAQPLPQAVARTIQASMVPTLSARAAAGRDSGGPPTTPSAAAVLQQAQLSRGWPAAAAGSARTRVNRSHLELGPRARTMATRWCMRVNPRATGCMSAAYRDVPPTQ